MAWARKPTGLRSGAALSGVTLLRLAELWAWGREAPGSSLLWPLPSFTESAFQTLWSESGILGLAGACRGQGPGLILLRVSQGRGLGGVGYRMGPGGQESAGPV